MAALTEISALAKISYGQLVFDSDLIKQGFWNKLRLFPQDTAVKILIGIYNPKREEEKKRTEAQNKYYHKLLDIICDYTGDEHQDLHTQLKIKFLSNPYVMEDKEIIVVKSTRDINPKEFGDYLEKVFKFASEEYSLVLPSSSDYY